MKPLRLLVATVLDEVGGTELSSLSVARWMLHAGHKVFVITNRCEHPLVEEFRSDNIKLLWGRMNARSVPGIIGAVLDMRRQVLQHDIEVIHAQTAVTALIAGLTARTIHHRRLPVIWHCRGIKDISYPIVGRVFNLLLDFVIANCNSERSRLLHGGLSSKKVQTIYNFPNITFPESLSEDVCVRSELGIDPNEKVVGTVARLSEKRGIRYFLQALPILLSKPLPRVRFIVIGSGPEEKELQQLASSLGLSESVIFTGARRDMGRLYSMLDIVVNPVLFEQGSGNVNAEAMIYGKPLVTTRAGGSPELVQDQVTGLLVKPKDATGLAEAIAYLLNNPDTARRLGAAGREKAISLLNPLAISQQIQSIYRNVLERKGGSIN